MALFEYTCEKCGATFENDRALHAKIEAHRLPKLRRHQGGVALLARVSRAQQRWWQ